MLKSKRVLTPQEFVESLTGVYYSLSGELVEKVIHKLLDKHNIKINGKKVRSFALEDIKTVIEKDINVVLVDTTGFNGKDVWESSHTWFEVPDDYDIEKYLELAETLQFSNPFENSDESEDEKGVMLPATLLPEGWAWKKFKDGSGSLLSPDGQSFFSYDMQPYATQGGIEYKEAEEWNVFWGTFEEFAKFAEEKMLAKIK